MGSASMDFSLSPQEGVKVLISRLVEQTTGGV